jgi:hypothetical protein
MSKLISADLCEKPFSGLKIIAEGDTGIFYSDQTEKTITKVFKGTCEDYQHDEYLKEVEQSLMISEFIKSDKISKDYYLQMIFFHDCCGSSDATYFSSMIVFPEYKYSLQHLILTEHNVEKLRNIISKTLTAYLILYQVTGMIHGNFTHNNVLIDNEEPIIGGFGKMKETKICNDHIKEFIWFIIPIRDYVSGNFDGIKRPWLENLIQPAFIKSLTAKNYFEITSLLTKPASVDVDSVFSYWIH